MLSEIRRDSWRRRKVSMWIIYLNHHVGFLRDLASESFMSGGTIHIRPQNSLDTRGDNHGITQDHEWGNSIWASKMNANALPESNPGCAMTQRLNFKRRSTLTVKARFQPMSSTVIFKIVNLGTFLVKANMWNHFSQVLFGEVQWVDLTFDYSRSYCERQ